MHSGNGFTLVELAIVLVIIGLLVGGVLAGRDLISSAAMRSQISQINGYDAAVNTFRDKYGGIPGDLSVRRATVPGFTITGCDGSIGKRDGDGLVRPSNYAYLQGFSEVELFWQDLGLSGLIAGQYPNNGATDYGCQNGGVAPTTTLTMTPGTTYIGDYLPVAKLTDGTFIYVYNYSGFNWYGLSAISAIANTCMTSSATVPVIKAAGVDAKLDDGMPTAGRVQAIYYTCAAAPTLAPHNPLSSVNTCYDGTANTYSTQVGGGDNPNCALSFRFQ